ncbi:nodulation protein NodH [Neogemmobacter tilapiae]|uniref:nodulation protein NodH n=1 Tax=Neogemmobacter tilapiae TaxID=875041 RepID=UPI001675664F|nr:nodulation protein NodH [Gemmobacter tilapiae]
MFRSFVILGGMRTGSNYLESTLNAVPEVAGYGELFNPEFIGRAQQQEFLGFDLAMRDADPLAFLAKVRAETRGLSGLRLFDDHDARVLAHVLDDPTCGKILLTRNPVESFVSLQIARETGQWKLGNARALRQSRVKFDLDAFESYLRDVQSFHEVIRNRLQVTGQAAFQIDYGDLGNVEVLNGLLAWLGLAARLDRPADQLKRQNPGPLQDKLTNPEVLDQVASRFDLLNLMRTPLSEPRRAPMGQGFIVSRGLGLVFMPIAGGPRDSLVQWMKGLIRGGVETGLNRNSYPKWRTARGNARAFTVLRHPMLRGWLAYQQLLRDDGQKVFLGHLQRMMRCELPSPEADAAAHRVGFLAFLRFVQMVQAGQTGLRTPARWTNQATLIEAMGQMQIPDLILREERLAEGLLFLGRQVGARRRPGYQDEAQDVDGLASVLTDELNGAARLAWARDYQSFGFSDWMPPQAG